MTPSSVPLPRKDSDSAVPASSSSPVWALSSDTPKAAEAPLAEKCDRHDSGRDGLCCKKLKGDDERKLANPDVVRDVVIGLSDGLTVPFALTAGLSSLGNSRIVVFGGVAELIAGTISMGIGGFLASQSERDHYRYLHRQTTARVSRSCVGEMEREVHEVLGPIGVDEKLSQQVARSLLASKRSDPTDKNADVDVEARAQRWNEEAMTEFLLKFGEGLEEVPTRRLYISAVTIGLGYLVGGIIPLLPYFFIPHARKALLYSSIITGVILIIFGIVKTYVSGAKGGFRGYAWGAISTLFVGGSAAAAAYGIVYGLEHNTS
ncbi:hypothetical protein EW145_g5444 [Phellinidium pouzarii]|uniref:DUF125-domain-containing protein n=1 Tax=Phellinidium pouzarii TaxID=167371 RepID=A0A4V3XC58_9AGAM|nr:hypothetical protein EW145_g5444 [Phellinidium pouzarii]